MFDLLGFGVLMIARFCVSKLDLILCFDGSMGFQLGDWC